MNNYNNYQKNLNYYQNTLPNNSNINDPYEGFIKGNMFESLYSPYRLDRPYQIEPMNEQAGMLTQLDALEFACIDLSMYLDIYQNDRNALNLFNQYRTEKNKLKEVYENKFSPLDLDSDALNTYPWVWDNRPWPWEN